MRSICFLKDVGVSTFALAGIVGALWWPAPQARSQTLPSSPPTKEDLARDNNLFLSLARKALKWDEPTDPIRIVGPLYFVGTQGLNGEPGTGSAAVGEVGEYVEATVASGSAVALTSGAAKTVTSITLTAGDWDVSGQVAFSSTGTTSFTIIAGSLSTTTDTSSSTLGRWNQTVSAAFVPGGVPVSTVITPSRFSISGPTQVFLVAFASSTCRHQAHMGSSEPDALAERYKATVIQSLVSKASSATLTVEEIAA
jgi:hypothetical protein